MCVSTKKYPLVLDIHTDKKQILFDYGIDFNEREQIKKLPFFIKELKLAENGFSHVSSYNKIMFNKFKFIDMVSVPCGICSECLKNQSQQWAARIMLESSLHQKNYFVTLTYDDDHVPSDGMLDEQAISNFNKKLRTYLSRNNRDPHFRFYGVGEYGTKTLRPHYHIIYFGLDLPDDLVFYKENKNGDIMYNSPFLTNVWQNGFVVVGEVTTGSACYVAKYCDKKRRLTTYEKNRLRKAGVVPEYSRMSNRPGIGGQFVDAIKNRVINEDNNVIQLANGQQVSVPMFYIKKIKEVLSEQELSDFNDKRKLRADTHLYQNLTDAEYADELIDRFNRKNAMLNAVRKTTL